MSDEARDSARDEAQARSRNCPHCGGQGLATVYDRDYDGRRVVDRDVIENGEIKRVRYAMLVMAHCACPLGRWIRSKVSRQLCERIPDLEVVLYDRTRWVIEDPTGDRSTVTSYQPSVRHMIAETGVKVGVKR